MTYYTPLTPAEFWTRTNAACCRTNIDEATQVLQFRNSKGLLSTEKWVFVGDHWLRVSIR